LVFIIVHFFEKAGIGFFEMVNEKLRLFVASSSGTRMTFGGLPRAIAGKTGLDA
jgi:hypothetical protein